MNDNYETLQAQLDEMTKRFNEEREHIKKLSAWAADAQEGARRFLVACGPLLERECGGPHWIDHLRECMNIEWTGFVDKVLPPPGSE